MTHKDEHTSEDPFSHLQLLIDALPAMQEKGNRLIQARAAQAVVAAAHEHDVASKTLDEFDAALQAATESAEQAQREHRPAEEIEHWERERLYFAAQRGFRVGPKKNTALKLEEALQSGGFENVLAARKVLLSNKDFDALAAEVEAYQVDYAATLTLCKEQEGLDT